MYNKYFTMKRSELKEAIKAEIKSVLTEEIQVGDIVTLGGDGDELEVIDKRRMFGSDMMAYRVKFPDGNTEEYSGDQLRPARMMNEEAGFTEVSKKEIKFHLDQFYGGNIDGNDLANAIEEIVFNRVSFSDIREEDEPTDAEIKKADSVASAANKLQKLVKKMKDKAKDFKAAEGEAKEKIKDELKAMTAEKKKLEKSI